MIARFSTVWQTAAWQTELASAIRTPEELVRLLDLPEKFVEVARAASTGFALRAPQAYLQRIRRGDPNDPLLLQILPVLAELIETPGFRRDPVGDGPAAKAPGVLQKYHGRVLLVTTGACAIHCRYCFRRHFPYSEANAASDDWKEAVAFVESDPTIKEVILSGGDPLSLADHKLARLAEKLAAIPHVKYLRIHTRLPVVLPQRVDEALLRWLSATRLKTTVVIHSNHANEIDNDVRDALQKLKQAGVELLNQSVLLRGVNDDVDALAALSEALFDAGVLPYYLHLLDAVQGAAHFNVEEPAARALVEHLRRRLPGFLVPRLVREIEGEAHKTPIG